MVPQHFVYESAVIIEIPGDDLQQEVRFAGRIVATEYAGARLDDFLEFRSHLFAMLRVDDLHKCQYASPQLTSVQNRLVPSITPDSSRRF